VEGIWNPQWACMVVWITVWCTVGNVFQFAATFWAFPAQCLSALVTKVQC